MVDLEKMTFELSDLDETFWEKVVFINIWPTTGLGGTGSLWFITDDKKMYYISFHTFPYSETRLGEFTPLLNWKKNEEGEYIYEAEEKGWKCIEDENVLLRNDFYDAFMTVYRDDGRRKSLGWKKDHMPLLAGMALGLEGEPECFIEAEADKFRIERLRFLKELEETRKKRELTEAYFEWKPIHTNNIKSNGEVGLYTLLFKDEDNKTVGYKFSIVYQREEISPLHYYGKDSRIEAYNLFEKRYDDVQGPLSYLPEDTGNEFGQSRDYINRYYANTFSNSEINDFGSFVRSFSALEEAKLYAVAVTNIRNYVNKENIIMDLENPARVCRNRLRKYGAILEYGKVCNQILEIVRNYEQKDKITSGGGLIFREILHRTGMKEELLCEMWKYIPMVLSKEEQEKAQKIVEECRGGEE